jgi:hypothetical protein
LLAQLHRSILARWEALDQLLGSTWTSTILAVPQHLLKLCALLGPQQWLAGAWGASALAGCEGWTSGTLADVPICCYKTGVRYDI